MTNLRLRYQTFEFVETGIHLCTLRNRQEFHDPNGLAHFFRHAASLWGCMAISGSSCACHFRLQNRLKINFRSRMRYGFRSLILNKSSADITAPDYHPEADKFLQRNALLNEDNPIAFEPVD